MKEDDARGFLDAAFAIGYLDAYVRDGDTIKKFVPERNPDEVEHDVECPSCAAKFTYRGASGKCPYCGTVYRTEEHCGNEDFIAGTPLCEQRGSPHPSPKNFNDFYG